MVKIGARWDDSSQDARFIEAKRRSLLDYAEVNFPVSPAEDPFALGLPVLAHTSNNPLCSVEGIDSAIASKVKEGADRSNSPWIGEHVAWLGFAPTGALGYILNPLFTTEFADIACQNIEALKAYYGRPVALELGPVYNFTGDFRNELEFLSFIARETDSKIILDITHWLITNKNLNRRSDYGLEDLALDRVIELHVAGMRAGAGSRHWHDAHGIAPSAEVISMARRVSKECKNLEAITLEHAIDGREEDFYSTLSVLKEACL